MLEELICIYSDDTLKTACILFNTEAVKLLCTPVSCQEGIPVP